MTLKAEGTFEVKLTPQALDERGQAAAIGRMLIDKQFRGPLEGVSAGQMIAFRSAVAGSAGYVAMERVVGKLAGKSGSFVLQHSGKMDNGLQDLSVTVVPDSGTGELQGLKGTMKIIVADGKHSYVFEYTLP
jgi:hypothetical protein